MAFIALAAFIIFIYRVVVVSGGVMAARNMELQVIEVKLVEEWIYAITIDIYRIHIENWIKNSSVTRLTAILVIVLFVLGVLQYVFPFRIEFDRSEWVD